jgi:hypothetical protein
VDYAEQLALTAAIELLYGCGADFRTHEIVAVSVDGRPVLQRNVASFALVGHPTASACYAWTESGADGRRAHYRVVLQAGPVSSARDAVQTSLLREPPERHAGEWRVPAALRGVEPPTASVDNAAPRGPAEPRVTFSAGTHPTETP